VSEAEAGEITKPGKVGFIAPMDAGHVDGRPQKRRRSGGSTKVVSTATKRKKVRAVAADHSDGVITNHKEVQAVADDHVDSPTTNHTVISVVPVNMVLMEGEDTPANWEVIGGVGTPPIKDDGALPNIGQPSLVNTSEGAPGNTSEGAPGNNGKGTLGDTGKGTLDNTVESTPPDNASERTPADTSHGAAANNIVETLRVRGDVLTWYIASTL